MYGIIDCRTHDVVYTCDTKTDALIKLELLRDKDGYNFVIREIIEEDPFTPGVYAFKVV